MPEVAVAEGCENNALMYNLPEGVPRGLEMRIEWAKVTEKLELDEEILNGVFVVAYSYVE